MLITRHLRQSIGYVIANAYFASFFLLFLSHADMAFGGRKFDYLPFAPTITFILFSFPPIFILFCRFLISPAFQAKLLSVMGQNKAIITSMAAIVSIVLLFTVISDGNWAARQDTAFLYVYAFCVLLVSMLLPFFRVVKDNFVAYVLVAWLASIAALGVDLAVPGTFSYFDTRAAGLEADSNTFSFLLVSLCGLFIRYDKVRSGDVIALIVTLVSVIATASRSGIIQFALLLLFYGFQVFKRSKISPGRAIGGLVALGVLGLAVRFAVSFLFQTSSVYVAGTQDRLTSVSGRDPRVLLALQYLNWIGESPFTGFGTGFAEGQVDGAHNMYLQLWVNNGVMAPLLYCGLLGSAAYLFYRRGFLPGLLFIIQLASYGLFSHTVFTFRSIFMALGTLSTLSLLMPSANKETTS